MYRFGYFAFISRSGEVARGADLSNSEVNQNFFNLGENIYAYDHLDAVLPVDYQSNRALPDDNTSAGTLTTKDLAWLKSHAI